MIYSCDKTIQEARTAIRAILAESDPSLTQELIEEVRIFGTGATTQEAIETSVCTASALKVMYLDGKPMCVLGVNPADGDSCKLGVVWAVIRRPVPVAAIKKHLRAIKEFLKEHVMWFPHGLVNLIPETDVVSLHLASRLGMSLEPFDTINSVPFVVAHYK